MSHTQSCSYGVDLHNQVSSRGPLAVSPPFLRPSNFPHVHESVFVCVCVRIQVSVFIILCVLVPCTRAYTRTRTYRKPQNVKIRAPPKQEVLGEAWQQVKGGAGYRGVQKKSAALRRLGSCRRSSVMEAGSWDTGVPAGRGVGVPVGVLTPPSGVLEAEPPWAGEGV